MPETPTSPASPISPSGSAPSSVRAIVNWLETSSANGSGSSAVAITSRPVVNRGSHMRARGTVTSSASSPPPLLAPVPKLPSPPSVVVTPPNSSSKSTAVHSNFETAMATSAAAVSPLSKPPQTTALSSTAFTLSPCSSPHHNKETTQDYSKTLLRYQAFFSQSQSENNAADETKAAGRSGMGKRKGYGDLGRRTVEGPANCHASTANIRYGRDKNEVDAYWSSVRAQLLIADEEIYGSS